MKTASGNKGVARCLVALWVLGHILLFYPDSWANAADQTAHDTETHWNEESGDDTAWEEADAFPEIDYDTPLFSAQPDSRFQFGGFVKEELAYRLKKSDPSWAKVRTIVNLETEADLTESWEGKLVFNGFYDLAYAIEGREIFTPEALDQQEAEAEIRDAYVSGPLWGQIRLKMGRQIIPWGESEFVQITDIANPRDQTEFGMVDLEDARLPVFSTKLSWAPGRWDLNAVAVHEIRPNKIGAGGTDFDPYQTLREGGSSVAEAEIPRMDLADTELMVRAKGRFNGKDLAIVAGDYFDDAAYLDFDSAGFNTDGPQVRFTPRHKRVQMAGISGDLVSGQFLWKFETGCFFNKAIARNDLEKQLAADPAGGTVSSWKEKDTIQALAGLEYSGIDDLRLTLETAVTHIPTYEDILRPDQTALSIFLLADYRCLNQTLSYNFQWGHFASHNDNICRLTVTYMVRDALEVSVGGIMYRMPDSDSPLHAFRNQDRLFGGIKYSF